MFNEQGAAASPGGMERRQMLDILAYARPDRLKELAENILAGLGDIHVITNRTGLIMVPMRDTVENVDFHLGEVLVSEAHIADAAGAIGYGMITGRDLERAMAMAVVDLFIATGKTTDAVRTFLEEERDHRTALDMARMRQVEATRVEMETF